MPGSVEEQGQSCHLGNVVNAILERTYLVISHAFGISKPVQSQSSFFDWGSQVCKWMSQVALHVSFQCNLFGRLAPWQGAEGAKSAAMHHVFSNAFVGVIWLHT